MSRRLRLLLLLVGLLSIIGCHAWGAGEIFDAGKMESVTLYAPARTPSGLVVLFSDAGGWNDDLAAAAQALSERGALVAGVDLSRYMAVLEMRSERCHYVDSDLEDLSHRLQRRFAFAHYRSPILAGVGAGGTLAYAALAQAPAQTIGGAASLDPAPSLPIKVPLCPGAPPSPAPSGGFAYGATAELPGWWRIATEDPSLSRLAAQVATAGNPVTIAAPSRGSIADRMVALLAPALTLQPAEAGALADLPLVEIEAKHKPDRLFAVIYSGDGGWRDLDKTVGEVLAERGVPVVGVDCLRYFWHAKTPDQVAGDLTAIIEHYRRQWGTERIVLIGYSFGADVLPFAVNRLPETVRRAIVQTSLLGVEQWADFEIKISGWLGAGPGSDALPLLPEIAKLDRSSLQCFFGEQEEDTACTNPGFSGAEIIRTTGGHHFDGDYSALAEKILTGARRRLAAK